MRDFSINEKHWTKWHARLHKRLLANKDLIPNGASILLSVSGGQDSMALLKLIIDLKELHKWELNVWHGDHQWHEKSELIAQGLNEWCVSNNINIHITKANRGDVISETSARDWRYHELNKTADWISSKNKNHQCKYILTGHTGSDRAETFIMNLARGSGLDGLGSLKESRILKDNIFLVRPLLMFSRLETLAICKHLNLPIWIDPSNKDTDINRNKIREQVIPILEEIHSGCSIRIAQLAERISKSKEEKTAIEILALKAIKSSTGINREEFTKLPISARATILIAWIKEKGGPSLNSKQLEDISYSLGKGNPPGSRDLGDKWKISWDKYSIQLTFR